MKITKKEIINLIKNTDNDIMEKYKEYSFRGFVETGGCFTSTLIVLIEKNNNCLEKELVDYLSPAFFGATQKSPIHYAYDLANKLLTTKEEKYKERLLQIKKTIRKGKDKADKKTHYMIAKNHIECLEKALLAINEADNLLLNLESIEGE